jgi:hypothetical protein
LQATASAGDVRMPEDMQDYLARMNKQLEEMTAQHLQVRQLNIISTCLVAASSFVA